MSNALVTQGTPRYLKFWHAASKRGKEEYEAAGGRLPGFSLHANGLIIPLGSNTVTLSAGNAQKVLLQTDVAGKIVKAYREKDFPGHIKKVGNFDKYYVDGNPKEFTEAYYVLGVLWTPAALYPVAVNLRGPAANGVKNLVNNMPIAEDAARWAVYGPGYDESAKAHHVAGRCIATVKLEPKKAKQSEMMYVAGSCVVRRTNKEEVERFNSLANDSVFSGDLAATQASWERQVKLAVGEVTNDSNEEDEVV